MIDFDKYMIPAEEGIITRKGIFNIFKKKNNESKEKESDYSDSDLFENIDQTSEKKELDLRKKEIAKLKNLSSKFFKSVSIEKEHPDQIDNLKSLLGKDDVKLEDINKFITINPDDLFTCDLPIQDTYAVVIDLDAYKWADSVCRKNGINPSSVNDFWEITDVIITIFYDIADNFYQLFMNEKFETLTIPNRTEFVDGYKRDAGYYIHGTISKELKNKL